MPFQPNDTVTCKICEKLYETGNNAFTLNCADEGCRGHMCWDSPQKEQTTPTMPRPVCFVHRAWHCLDALFVVYAWVHATHGVCMAL